MDILKDIRKFSSIFNGSFETSEKRLLLAINFGNIKTVKLFRLELNTASLYQSLC